MVKARKAPAKRAPPAARHTRASGKPEAPKAAPKAPLITKSKAKKVVEEEKKKKQVVVEEEKKKKQVVVEDKKEDEVLDMGAQKQRWINFVKEQSVSPEEAAKLLLDSFEYKGLVKHNGGCHCGAVRFEVWASADIHVFDCNCSICVKKQNRHFIVPSSRFKLLKGAGNLTTYTFNTKKAQHTFCKTCGVQSFYTPRSNPDGYGIAAHCLDEGTVRNIHVEEINGKEWEKAMKEHKTIRSMSKS